MKKFWLFGLVGVLIMAFPLSVLAQSDDPVGPAPSQVTSQNGDILAELSVGTQSPWNGQVPVKLRFGSKIAGQKMQVIWRYPSSLKGSEASAKFYTFEVNQAREVVNNISPLTEGSHVLVVDVVVWGNDSNYVTTTQTTLRFNKEFLLQPQTAAYRNAVMLRYAVLVVLGLGGLVVIFFGGRFLIRLIPKWLEREVNKV